jgi:hypothetical protein
MSRVRAALDNTGVVHGEFGFAEAYRAKKKLLEDWLADSVTEVRDFAEIHMRELDNRIADETRRAETDTAMRNLKYSRPEPSEDEE